MSIDIRSMFKILESIITKVVVNQRLVKKETILPVLNSPNFEDPYDLAQRVIGEDDIQKIHF